MYVEAFQGGQFGYGAAIAVVMLILLIPIMVFNIRRFRSGDPGMTTQAAEPSARSATLTGRIVGSSEDARSTSRWSSSRWSGWCRPSACW